MYAKVLKAGKNPDDVYVLSMTAFINSTSNDIETREVREAVGPMVASSSNIFALSCHQIRFSQRITRGTSGIHRLQRAQ